MRNIGYQHGDGFIDANFNEPLLRPALNNLQIYVHFIQYDIAVFDEAE